MKKDVSLELFVALSRAYQSVMEHAKRDIRRHFINPTEFAVLELLYHKGAHPLQQIGEKILLASGSITYVVGQLEKKGLLNRRICPEDRRITFAEISDQGRQLLDDIFPEHEAAIRKAVQGLNDQEKETALQLLKKLWKEAKNQLQ